MNEGVLLASSRSEGRVEIVTVTTSHPCYILFATLSLYRKRATSDAKNVAYTPPLLILTP